MTANPDIQTSYQTPRRLFHVREASEAQSEGAEAYIVIRSPFYRHYFKTMMDIVVVLVSAPFVLPLISLMALVIGCRGGSPFYIQERVGQNGKIYKMWKLRTMCHGADTKLEDHLLSNSEARAEWDSLQKLKNDPRITGFGRLLRKTSLDELPQLWNVLKGDMSLVGPRPMMPQQQELYYGTAYYRLRPGVTGSWQISDRNESAFADRAKFDDSYDQCVSLKADLKILLGTVRVVLRGTGH